MVRFEISLELVGKGGGSDVYVRQAFSGRRARSGHRARKDAWMKFKRPPFKSFEKQMRFVVWKTCRSCLLAVAAVMGLSACVSNTQAPSESFQLVWPGPPDPARYRFERTIRSSTDIIKETTAQKFKRIATGQIAGGSALQKPYGLAARNGILYVGDTQNRRVLVFDARGNRYFEIGTKGPGALAKPLGMAIDKKGNLYVVDGTAKRVVIYDQEGKFIGAVGGREKLKRPTGVAVNDDGSRIYVVDTGGIDTQKHQVTVFNPEGEVLFTFGKRGTKPGEFNLPLNAAMGPNGILYVVDGGNFRIQAFDGDGQFQFTFGSIGKRSGQFARPKGITVSREGNIFVSDAAFGNVQVFNSKGQLLMWIGNRSTTNGPGNYLLPSGVAVDQIDGRLYFADQFFRKVDVYTREGGVGKPSAKPEKNRPSS